MKMFGLAVREGKQILFISFSYIFNSSAMCYLLLIFIIDYFQVIFYITIKVVMQLYNNTTRRNNILFIFVVSSVFLFHAQNFLLILNLINKRENN